MTVQLNYKFEKQFLEVFFFIISYHFLFSSILPILFNFFLDLVLDLVLILCFHDLFNSTLFKKLCCSFWIFFFIQRFLKFFLSLHKFFHFFSLHFDSNLNVFFHDLHFHGRLQVRPVLDVLLTDKDRDVQHFASESLKICP